MNAQNKKSAKKRTRSKTTMLCCRATLEQKQRLDSMAEALGRDRSDLMLEAIFQGEVKIPNTDPKLLRLNIEIKNELNQIARTCHANAKNGQTLDLLSVLVSLKEIKKRFDSHAL